MSADPPALPLTGPLRYGLHMQSYLFFLKQQNIINVLLHLNSKNDKKTTNLLFYT